MAEVLIEKSNSIEEPQVASLTITGLSSKRCFIDLSANDSAHIVAFFKERLKKSHGETIFMLGCEGVCAKNDSAESNSSADEEPGLTEEEITKSLENMRSIFKKEDIIVSELKMQKLKTNANLNIVYLLIRSDFDGEEDFIDVRVAVVGNVDAGKSTLLGVLTHYELDNGRGSARLKLFRHKHEIESGRTSSVAHDIMGFTADGTIVKSPDNRSMDWAKICRKSAKIITFIDLAGHERYLKTTVFGMTGHAPDFTMLMVGANVADSLMTGMTKEHLSLALALSVPVFVVITKVDMTPPSVLQETMKLLFKMLKARGSRKMPILIQSEDDVVVAAMNFTSERMCPVFQVSNVTGENLHLLKCFLNLLNSRHGSLEAQSEPAEFSIDETFQVQGVGTIASGICLKGSIKFNDIVLIGPDKIGDFHPITIKGVHRKRLPVTEVHAGQTASFALKKIKRNQIRKGMVLVSPALNPKATWAFQGDVLVLHHPSTMSCKYQAVVHIGGIRQTATITAMDECEFLRTGDKAKVTFRFIKNPEFIHVGSRFVFREGRTKAIGQVSKLLFDIIGPQTARNAAAVAAKQKQFLPKPKTGGKKKKERIINDGASTSQTHQQSNGATSAGAAADAAGDNNASCPTAEFISNRRNAGKQGKLQANDENDAGERPSKHSAPEANGPSISNEQV